MFIQVLHAFATEGAHCSKVRDILDSSEVIIDGWLDPGIFRRWVSFTFLPFVLCLNVPGFFVNILAPLHTEEVVVRGYRCNLVFVPVQLVSYLGKSHYSVGKFFPRFLKFFPVKLYFQPLNYIVHLSLALVNFNWNRNCWTANLFPLFYIISFVKILSLLALCHCYFEQGLPRVLFTFYI